MKRQIIQTIRNLLGDPNALIQVLTSDFSPTKVVKVTSHGKTISLLFNSNKTTLKDILVVAPQWIKQYFDTAKQHG